MLKQKSISEFKKNDEVNHYFIVSKSELRKTKNNDEFLSLELSDKNSSITSNIWKDVKGFPELRELSLDEKLTGKIIKVFGKVGEYNNILTIETEEIRLCSNGDDVSMEDFLKVSERKIDEMIKKFKAWMDRIKEPNIKKLINTLFDSKTLERFSKHPAGKNWHHAYLGGLIEHTLEIIEICNLMCKFHKEINRDLLIAGAMIHDLGKIEEISPEVGFEYTTKGKLLGHITIAVSLVEDAIKKIGSFPEDLKLNLLHLLLSHQGKLENASPVVPKTLEAAVLYHADELSAKANAYKTTLQKEQKTQSGWTKYINLANTELFEHKLHLKSNYQEGLFD